MADRRVRFRAAIELNPSYAIAYRMLGIILSHLGKAAKSLAVARRGREPDPLNATHHVLSSPIAFAARDYPEAIQLV